MTTVRDGVLAIIRVLVGLLVIALGVLGLRDRPAIEARLDRYSLPSPAVLGVAASVACIVLGVVLLTGLATRLAALLLTFLAAAALATGGRIDGGRTLIVLALLTVGLLVLVGRGGGGWQAIDLVDPDDRRPRRS